MKKQLIRGMMLALGLILTTSQTLWAANKKTTVAQVTSSVTLTDDVDYIISSATPFGDNGVVDISNTEHAVLILAAVKPSAAINLLSKHVQVAGQRAVYNTNCQVKLYNRGCIIMPYDNSFKPLTVYSEPNFEGESCNDFGLEHTGGYMNTLTDAKLNNKIRSFKLKRGYMVTFANGKGGRGYSRCFIAADADLEVANMPAVLDRSISSYRVFKWYDAGKKNLASAAGYAAALSALNVQSTYDWGEGNSSLLPDYEWVPNHIYEDWPSSSAIGSTTQSPHSKTNNEPFNSSDDHPQDLKTILNNWENMMRTGMRLCSPASHDGALGLHHDFLDSIDARGWRCDIIDLHCYWNEWNFSNQIKSQWVDRHHRPVWISEWIWGSSWGNNGIFEVAKTKDERDNPSTAHLNKNKEIVENICNALNGFDYIERYYYWNSEANCSKLYYDNKLTPAGEMYAALDAGLGYNGKYDYAPKVVKQRDPANFTLEYDNKSKVATLKWHDYNGEMNGGIYIERRTSTTTLWEVIADVPMQEDAADYTYEDTNARIGYQYRVLVVDGNSIERRTKALTAAAKEVLAGDAIEINGATRYLGGNLFLNGNFMMGLNGWTNGEGKALAAPYFQVVAKGGYAGRPYLQCYGEGDVLSEQSIYQVVDLKPNTDYYFAGALCNNAKISYVYGSNDGTTIGDNLTFVYNSSDTWQMQSKTFSSGEYTKAILSCRQLGAKSQFGNFIICPLFENQADAVIDGIANLRQVAELFQSYNTSYPVINTDLAQKLGAVTVNDAEALATLQTLIDNAYTAYDYLKTYAEKKVLWQKYVDLKMPGYETLQEKLTQFDNANTIASIIEYFPLLVDAVEEYMPLTTIKDIIASSDFSSTTGWTTKCGTYTAGDQRSNKKNDITFWNAWWSGIDASEGTTKSMAIKQEVDGLSHGLYSLECKASTEHFCLSDQHGYITDGEQVENTPVLTADYFDLPTVEDVDRWQTLLTAPIYIPDDSKLTIGFIGTKEGAVNDAWHAVGDTKSVSDKREGWWGATDFVFKFHPQYRKTVEPNQWNVTCLPYAVKATDDVKFYMIGGITSDLKNIRLYEVTEMPAGHPLIYKSSKADVTFFEYGEKVDEPVFGQGNLWGYFKTSARVPKKHYYLENGVWKKAGETSDTRPRMTSYTAVILPFDDTIANYISKKDSWEGETMPIEGLTEEEYALGISQAVVQPLFVEDGMYTIDGRRVNSTNVRQGIYLKVENGKVYKVIQKN
jgi:hypothetical protein